MIDNTEKRIEKLAEKLTHDDFFALFINKLIISGEILDGYTIGRAVEKFIENDGGAAVNAAVKFTANGILAREFSEVFDNRGRWNIPPEGVPVALIDDIKTRADKVNDELLIVACNHEANGKNGVFWRCVMQYIEGSVNVWIHNAKNALSLA